MIDAQTLAEMNNLRICLDDREGKIDRQAGVIVKLELSRKDMKAESESLLRVARAAKPVLLNVPHGQSLSSTEEAQIRVLEKALKEVEHLL